MLRLIIGTAGTGKTALVTDEIKSLAEQNRGGILFIVPEQYSHEAERELCKKCGDSISLYAEVLSFTGLARRQMARQGGMAASFLDEGGRLLCMALAAKNAVPSLKAYARTAGRPEVQSMFLSAVDTMKSSCISPDRLREAAGKCSSGELAEKLFDLAAVYEAYEGVLGESHADSTDRLNVLASQIPKSDFGPNSRIYVDGFTDFTKIELQILRELLKKEVELTVCLTLDDVNTGSEIFSLSRSSARVLKSMAKELGIGFSLELSENKESEENGPLHYYADRLFSYSDEAISSAGKIELLVADSISDECEIAAAKVLEAVRSGGCRWRDVAIAVRGYEDYSTILETTFEDYGVPLFSAAKKPLSSKPLPMFISGAYSIILGSWCTDDVINYMGTGLTGLSAEQRDILGTYIYRWQLKGNAWRGKGRWKQHPEGFGGKYDAAAEKLLEQINSIRDSLAAPLLVLEKKSSAAVAAGEHVRALADFLEMAGTARILSDKAEKLEIDGKAEEAGECCQLWQITVNAMEQFNAVLGDTRMTAEEFARLFVNVLSRYDVGTIPVSLDMVSAGDFDRMRRRNIRQLIILGADDERIPASEGTQGMFSADELASLKQQDLEFGGNPDDEIWREYSLLYNCISLPSEKLILCRPARNKDGNETQPSLPMVRAESIFGMKSRHFHTEEARMAAAGPAMLLAARVTGPRSAAAEHYFTGYNPERLEHIRSAAGKGRGSLSGESVKTLYGDELKISASRAETWYSCRYEYFCRHGLHANAFKTMDYSAADFGTFVHYVLENTAREVGSLGGFDKVERHAVETLAKKYIDKYIHDILNDFSEKSERFIYLFKRLEKDVLKVVLDNAEELAGSKFVPLAFELELNGEDAVNPVLVGKDGERLIITGKADRVDGWISGDETFLRIVDYKTGKKEFDLSEVWYGLSLQMLMYLYALSNGGPDAAKALGLPEGSSLRPAGIMYVPAKSRFKSVKDSSEADKETKSRLKRKGLVLTDCNVPEAWETTEEKTYIPLSFDKSGKIKGKGAANEEQFCLLFSHIEKRLCEMAEGIRNGEISADPLKIGSSDNGKDACKYCDFRNACGFADGENGENVREFEKKTDEEVWEMMAREADAE